MSILVFSFISGTLGPLAKSPEDAFAFLTRFLVEFWLQKDPYSLFWWSRGSINCRTGYTQDVVVIMGFVLMQVSGNGARWATQLREVCWEGYLFPWMWIQGFVLEFKLRIEPCYPLHQSLLIVWQESTFARGHGTCTVAASSWWKPKIWFP